MSYKSDIEIAQEATLEPIGNIAERAGLNPDEIIPYGHYMAKVPFSAIKQEESKAKLILVTAINPTPAGEGKTTTTVGLGDGLRRIGKRAAVALREPSLGPVFGVKGGAAGGGYAQVVPMENLNLHFTGDFHAIGAANNLLAAMLDNHIHQGNALNIDTRRIVWNRCVDMNDRQLRNIVIGLGKRGDGITREDHFDITVASEVMAAFCLATSLEDLEARLGRMIVAYTNDKKPVTCADLKAQGAMTALLKDALQPNLVQTLEGTPAFVHGGPFANIAHGCNSVMATKLAMQSADYAVTEAGFGADLGAEKFLDIKCRAAGLNPAVVVIVATVRALKHHGGADLKNLNNEDIDALKKGMPNLEKHIQNLQQVFNSNVVVAINRFPTDTEKELETIRELTKQYGVEVVLSEVWGKGGEGGMALAEKVVELCDQEKPIHFAYDLDEDPAQKIEDIAKKVYGASAVEITAGARRQIREAVEMGFGNLPICMAKTQYSFSDDPTLLGAPSGFTLTVRNVRVSAGAGFLVALTGEIMTMPGLPKVPSAENIDVDSAGNIHGLF
ncbi:MAG: formate--tetrahydrofolate ligase [Eubacteriales bacterium]|nr:formate--tetrahydrofolate ligase [Clostridiales bacterium]MDY5836255.1 formate--tetrahydrofolate ligase [Eubacteriales bacterium]